MMILSAWPFFICLGTNLRKNLPFPRKIEYVDKLYSVALRLKIILVWCTFLFYRHTYKMLIHDCLPLVKQELCMQQCGLKNR